MTAVSENQDVVVFEDDVRWTKNSDGWITIQLVDHPEAVSQGRTLREAHQNVLSAWDDLIAASMAAPSEPQRPETGNPHD